MWAALMSVPVVLVLCDECFAASGCGNAGIHGGVGIAAVAMFDIVVLSCLRELLHIADVADVVKVQNARKQS